MMKVKVSDIAAAVNGSLLQDSGDVFIDGFSTNSKEIAQMEDAAVLFVPIMGERVDGHRFIGAAVEAGAKACFVREGYEVPAGLPESFCVIEVEDTRRALQDAAAWYRGLFPIPVVGITGSVGKTSTKEMVAAALSSALDVHKTSGNQNSQIGLPLSIFGIEQHHQVAVIEMGMSEFGEMERLARIARPQYAAVTNIGVAHIGNLHSQENIRSEKLKITEYFDENGVLFLNLDDPLLKEVADSRVAIGDNVKHIVTYGTDPEADFAASSVSLGDDGTDFVLTYPKREDPQIRVSEHVHLAVLGLHHVRNALTAFAIAYALGINPETAKVGLERYRPMAMRGNIVKTFGRTIIDDTYNASPDSMKSAIEVLGAMRGGVEPIRRRIVVFADVLELGESSESEHYGVGEFIREYNKKDPDHRVNYLVTIGKDAEQIAFGATADIGYTNPVAKHFTDNADAAEYLKSLIVKGDAILVKGSRGMHTEEIVKALSEEF